jgi:hypothetical protein
MGQALKYGRVRMQTRLCSDDGVAGGDVDVAVRFYNFQLKSYRKAVDMWTCVGLRNKVVKDIRKMIGKMIWNRREEAE